MKDTHFFHEFCGTCHIYFSAEFNLAFLVAFSIEGGCDCTEHEGRLIVCSLFGSALQCFSMATTI